MPIYPYEPIQDKADEGLVALLDGDITWRFSQANSSIVQMPKKARSGPIHFENGICLSLSANWINEHAKGSSLVTNLGLYRDGGRVIPLNTDQLCVLTCQQRSWNGSIEAMLKWLKNRGIIEVRRSHIKLSRHPWLPKLTTTPASEVRRMKGFVDKPIKFSTDLRKVSAAYAVITIAGNEYGHAMSAWIGAKNEGACFFDSNFGECSFNRREDFFMFASEYIGKNYPNMPHYTIYTLAPRAGGKCDNGF